MWKMIPCTLWTNNQQTAYSEVKFGIELLLPFSPKVSIRLIFSKFTIVAAAGAMSFKRKKNAKKPLQIWENIKLIL